MEKIKIAQIGVGHDHATAVLGGFRKCEDFEVVGYALPEGEEREYAGRLSAFDGLRKMTVEEILSDADIAAVSVETEEHSLTKYALLAARAGKHIHMDKPGGLSVAEFEELVAAVKEMGVTLHLGYMYRYNPMLERVIREIREGKLGEIFSVEAEMNGAYPDPSRTPWLERFGKGGMMFFLGCHMVDLAVRILGTPDRVTTHSISSGVTGSSAVDCGMAVLEYPHARATVRTSSVEWGGNRRRHLTVSGSLGTVEVRPLELETPDGLVADATYYIGTPWGKEGVTERCEPFGRYDAMISAFAKMVRGEAKNPFTPDYELSLYKIFMEACDLL